jgi:hypothetical protein
MRLEEEKGTREGIRQKLDQILDSEPERLARISDFGAELSFAECVPVIKRIIELFRDAKEGLDVEELSLEALQRINSSADSTIVLFRAFSEFSLTQPPNRNLLADRTQLVNRAWDHYNQLFRDIAPIIAFCSTKQGQIDHLNRQALEMVDTINKELTHLQAVRAQADSTLELVKGLAQQAGVSQHAVVFAEEARSHRIASRWWLGATAALTALTGWAGVHFYQVSVDASKTYSGQQAVQAAVAKVALLSILFTATLWVGRMYRSHRHNAVVNKHRSNALRTFETFVNATKDDSTKNAVLIKATECIFSPQQTGYISHEAETGGVAQVVEIVRGIAGKNG